MLHVAGGNVGCLNLISTAQLNTLHELFERFSNNILISQFMNNSPMVVDIFQADRRKDGRKYSADEANVAFSQSCEWV